MNLFYDSRLHFHLHLHAAIGIAIDPAPNTQMTAPTKKRKPAAVLPNKTHKSQERVVESSDDETQETMTTTTSMTTTTGTETETESGSEFESESGSETERDNEPAKTTPKPAKTTPKPAKTTAKSTKTHIYAPPPHFTLAPVPTDGRSNPFSDRNLAGKELWFITAPVAAPLSKLAVVNLADIAASAPVMQTGSGKQYCIRSHDAVEEEIEGVELAVHDGRGGYRIGRILPSPPLPGGCA